LVLFLKVGRWKGKKTGEYYNKATETMDPDELRNLQQENLRKNKMCLENFEIPST